MLRRVAIPLVLALMTATGAQAATSDTLADYATRWPLQLPADASLVRLPLPANVLTQLQTRDLRDLRVFNAAGQPVPVALDRANPETQVATPPAIALVALPILADPQAGAADRSGLSLRIHDGPNGRVVQLETPSATAAAGAPVPPESVLTGALIDTREQKAAVQAVELDADWPAARPFTFRLYASADLRQWQALGEVTSYRSADDTVMAPVRINLDGISLKERYLRIGWDAAAPGAVQVRGARLLPVPPQALPARVAVPLALPDTAARDPRVLTWRMPFATPVAALDIRSDGSAALVPVRVLARQQREQPWTPLARHVVFSLMRDDQLQRSPAIELGQATWQEWRVEADSSSPGFATQPQITAWLAPAQLVFVASGSPPFTLAAGRPNATPVALPLLSLIPGYEAGAQGKLPAASLATTVNAAPTAGAVAVSDPGDSRDSQRWILWAVLLTGVLALGTMAWKLLKSRP